MTPEPADTTGAFPATTIVVKTAGRTSFVAVETIDWIEAADYCVRLHARGRTYTIRESMSSLESRLDPRTFFRTHRSAIVNLDRVREVQPSQKGEHIVLLGDGTKVRLTRSRRSRLELVLASKR
jgi:two-component system LytT family response regulator